MTLLGYFGLLLLLLNWFTWLSPPAEVPQALLLILLVLPLMLPLRGLLRGTPYTHSWASFLSLFYFAVGVDTAFTYPHLRWLGGATVVLSLLFFTGCIFFAKHEKIRLGQPPG